MITVSTQPPKIAGDQADENAARPGQIETTMTPMNSE